MSPIGPRPSPAALFIPPGNQSRRQPVLKALTPAEVGIVAEVCRGLSNKEIAARLGRSPHTIKTHVANILLKLEVPTRGRLMALFCEPPSFDSDSLPGR